MFFYVDESGNTGNNLFDTKQPVLYYGVLSSKFNLDILINPLLHKLRKKLNVKRLHAVELRNDKLAIIVPDILNIHKKYPLNFDFYKIVKADYALISFFYQVFDAGLNPAVAGSVYWTPLRYAMTLKLAELFDEETLKRAWSAQMELNSQKAEAELVYICKTIIERVSHSPDERLKRVITDALQWVLNNPEKINYNASSREQSLQMAPNIIGFQLVMFGIANRVIQYKKQASKIIVDQQIQFNNAQKTLAEYYSKFPKNTSLPIGLGLPNIDFKGMPDIPITPCDSRKSSGLELVDIYLWIYKQIVEGKEISPALMPIIHSQRHRSHMDELSLQGVFSSWKKWFEAERPAMTEEDLRYAKEQFDEEEKNRVAAIKNSP